MDPHGLMCTEQQQHSQYTGKWVLSSVTPGNLARHTNRVKAGPVSDLDLCNCAHNRHSHSSINPLWGGPTTTCRHGALDTQHMLPSALGPVGTWAVGHNLEKTKWLQAEQCLTYSRQFLYYLALCHSVGTDNMSPTHSGEYIPSHSDQQE